MNIEYADIFNDRGKLYHKAMKQAPNARDAEFKNLFAANAVGKNSVVVDVPAGGGYLKKFLPPGCRYHPLEITHAFGVTDIPVVAWEDRWPIPPADDVICLAALHHYEDHESAIARLLRAAKPGGVLHIADVRENSSVSEFLDGFVGQYNGYGHDGNYFSNRKESLPFSNQVIHISFKECPWRFANEAEMITFSRMLFGLQGVTDNDIKKALSETVGFSSNADHIELHWALMYIEYLA
ncbi:MAG: methyltransferase domain-containing protein [Pseudomonadota bacterium]